MFFYSRESHPGAVQLLTYPQKCTAVYCCVQPTRAAPGEKQQQYSGSTSRGECCRSSTQNFFFFIHESHPAVVLLLTMYQQKCTAVVYCCVQTTRAAAGERRRASDVCGHSKYSSSSIVVVRVGRSVVVHKISFFIHESHPGVVPLLMYRQKCTAVYCRVQPTRAPRRTSDGGRARK